MVPERLQCWEMMMFFFWFFCSFCSLSWWLIVYKDVQFHSSAQVSNTAFVRHKYFSHMIYKFLFHFFTFHLHYVNRCMWHCTRMTYVGLWSITDAFVGESHPFAKTEDDKAFRFPVMNDFVFTFSFWPDWFSFLAASGCFSCRYSLSVLSMRWVWPQLVLTIKQHWSNLSSKRISVRVLHFFFYHDMMFLYTFGVTSRACWSSSLSGSKKHVWFHVCQADVKMLWNSCTVPFRAALETD